MIIFLNGKICIMSLGLKGLMIVPICNYYLVLVSVCGVHVIFHDGLYYQVEDNIIIIIINIYIVEVEHF